MNRATRLLACVGVICGAFACAWGGLLPGAPPEKKGAAQANWPAWRGANRDGKSPDTGLLKSWPDGGPKKLWAIAGLGHGYSNISLADGRIYTTGIVGRTLVMFCFGMTGEEKWQVKVGPGFTKDWGGSRATPTYDAGKLYLESGNGLVGCYDAKTGKTIWTRKLSEFGGRVPTWGFAESVLIVGDLAVVTPGGKSCIVALDKTTGKTMWRSPAFGAAQYSSPIHVKYRGVEMIVNGTHSGLLGVDAKTGKLLWSNPFAAGITASCPTPAFADGMVFWAAGYGTGGICLAVSAGFGETTATQAWKTDDMDCTHGGYVIVEGYIYGNNSSGWACIELKTGETKWRERGIGKGSICYADGMLYLYAERRGEVALVKATPAGYTQTGTFRAHGAGKSWAHPVVIGGRLYLRYGERLYCYDVRDKNATVKR